MRPPQLDETDHGVLRQIEDLRRRIQSCPSIGMVRKVTLAMAVRGSNSIEGYVVGVDDAFAALDDQAPMEADELAWRAVLGYRDATTYVQQLAKRQPLALSADTILALHFMMQRYDLTRWPGRWRPGEVFVFDEDTRVTVYVAPDADQVPGLIDELVNETDDSTDPTMVRAAMAHLNLVMIHPFKDGNGRMARCLQEYYRVLAKVGGGSWNPAGDTQPWIRFCLTAHYRQALRVEQRAELAGRLWIRAEEELARIGLPERCVQPLTEGLSHNAAGRDLTGMAKAGLLEPYGERRWRLYVPAEPIRAAAREVSAEVGRLFPADAEPYE